jgi:hypothetical protein
VVTDTVGSLAGERGAARRGHRRRESSIAVDRANALTLVVNGKSDGNAIGDAPTQVMSGLVAALLHQDPRRALVIGLGTGSTAGWLAAVPSIERVDVVELEPAVLHMAELCAPVKWNVLKNPKIHLVIDDGREVLLTTAEACDVLRAHEESAGGPGARRSGRLPHCRVVALSEVGRARPRVYEAGPMTPMSTPQAAPCRRPGRRHHVVDACQHWRSLHLLSSGSALPRSCGV